MLCYLIQSHGTKIKDDDKKIPFNTTKVISKQITRIVGRMISNTVRVPLVLPDTDGVMLEAAMLLSVGVPFSVDLGK